MPAALPAHAAGSFRIAAFVLAALLPLAGCGDDPASPPTPPPAGAAVRVSPDRTTLFVRDSVTLTATVDSLSDRRVTWRVGPAGSGFDLGRLVVLSNTTARYVAPDRVTSALDLGVQVTAVSVADTTIRATAVVVVPRIIVTVIPGSLASVPPDTWVPHRVTVRNTTVPGFELTVIAPSLADPGTWTVTGPTSALYRAPASVDATTTLDLLARSEDDPDRFSIANLTVRRGYRLPTAKPALRKYAPEWDGSATRLAFVQGPPWELAIAEVDAGGEQTVTPITWSGDDYDGRIAWSNDSQRLVFSESGGADSRVLGYVNEDGTGRGVLAPAAGDRYFEASFLPEITSGAPDSLLIAEWSGGVSSLRALSFDTPLPGSGRVVYSAPAGDTLRWPDATTISGFLAVAAARMNGGESEIVSLLEDGAGSSPTFPATGAGRRTQVRWARQSTVAWITYLWDVNHTIYRVRRIADQLPARLYSEFFPELGGDMATAGVFDQHAISRQLPDGSVALYVVEFPPSSFTGVPAAEDIERASIGVRSALAPGAWTRWTGGVSPIVGGLEVSRRGF